MRVVMRVTITGTRDGQDWPAAGSVVDLPDAEAAHLIAAGMAQAAAPVAETATTPEPAKATAKRASRKATARKGEER